MPTPSSPPKRLLVPSRGSSTEAAALVTGGFPFQRVKRNINVETENDVASDVEVENTHPQTPASLTKRSRLDTSGTTGRVIRTPRVEESPAGRLSRVETPSPTPSVQSYRDPAVDANSSIPTAPVGGLKSKRMFCVSKTTAGEPVKRVPLLTTVKGMSLPDLPQVGIFLILIFFLFSFR